MPIKEGTLCKFWDGDRSSFVIRLYGRFDEVDHDYPHTCEEGTCWANAQPIPEPLVKVLAALS